MTYESVIPNLSVLKDYKPLIQEFWREGLFEDMDRRYFRLVNRSPDHGDEIDWGALGDYSPFDTFREIFHGHNVSKQSYLDKMTHFDFKTLLPALLQVEDRVSMAHGVESRVPFLDHVLVEFVSTIPANVKFQNGKLKRLLRSAMAPWLPKAVHDRQDKMGFPVPLSAWSRDELRQFIGDVFTSQSALGREFVNNRRVLAQLGQESQFSRKAWGFLCLELWQQEFHDRWAEYRSLGEKASEGVCALS